jgi:RNA polymerase sigma factor (sigma-70 family)
MSKTPSFDRAMSGPRAGDEEAARQIVTRFTYRLIGLARTTLGPRLLARVDPEDVTQSVWGSFFHRQQTAPVDFGGWNNLWHWLVRMTVYKCHGKSDHHLADRRDIRQTRPLPADESDGAWIRALDREPTPEEGAELAETLESLYQQFDEVDHVILDLHLTGHSVQDIAPPTGLSERTVQRRLERAEKWLETQLKSASP